MKIQCSFCHVSEAAVLCCADEAALCLRCDQNVHDANKLATKHQRLPLSSSQTPKCDICQEAPGHFLCLEDRALLCKNCDVAIHSVNSLLSAHNRFLLPGVTVDVKAKAAEKAPSSSSHKTRPHSCNKISGQGEPSAFPKNARPVPTLTGEYTKDLPVKDSLGGEFSSTLFPFIGSSPAENTQPWQVEDLLLLGDCSEVDKGNLGSSFLKAADEELEVNRYMGVGLVPGSFWDVPDIPSPPRSSHKANYPPPLFVPNVNTPPM